MKLFNGQLILKKISLSFTVSFNNLKAYTNAERTRTFLALTMDELYLKKMLIILNKVDSVMKDFKLDTFYEVHLLEI